MPDGIEINLWQRFYLTVVAPLMREQFPALPHAACGISTGSEVLG